jgi:DNA (cytosine-5)-methyltransferase 1
MFKDTKDKGKLLNFIDLFAGAGGLSEGFFQAGFNPIAHVEMNEAAARTLETRSAYYYLKSRGRAIQWYYRYERGELSREQLFEHVPNEVIKTVINAEMSADTLPGIFARIDDIIREDNIKDVDVIIGGPPCQAYSLVGRAQSSHMNVPMEQDPRNELYKMYTKFLERYKPKMFVFENVAGITTARNGEVYAALQQALDDVGYTIKCQMQNAADFGVLQKRKRMIIIGWRKNTEHYYPEFKKKVSDAVVWDLLRDLSTVNRGEESDAYRQTYDECSDYLKKNKIRMPQDVVTHHIARPNNDRDVQIYGMVIDAYNNGGNRISYDRLPDELKTHRNQTSFKDRFKVVEGNDHACHTVLAHLAKDGHYFIHPDRNQCRSITVREAARLQTFPDNFYFEGSRGEKYKQIGNAVPPMMAKAIAEEIKKQLI